MNIAKQARTTKLRRAFGASEKTKERMAAALAPLPWTATCRKCGMSCSGTLAALAKGCPNCESSGEQNKEPDNDKCDPCPEPASPSGP